MHLDQESQSCNFSILDPWESHLISMTPTFLIYKINILEQTLFSVDCPGG